ncbi:hypothetical protein TYRP_022577 [Tyrophagus putrescentiae]|nr:hypothetical protein TYRP_022577 [Tyrophagus putrescentiae]
MSGQSKLQPQSQQQQQQQNHPPPELTNICFLAIFSQINVDDRISVRTVCLRWYHRVREAHARTVRSLTIALGNKYLNSLANLEGVVNWYSVASDNSVQLLTKTVTDSTSFNGSITELTFYLAHLSYSLEHLIMMLGEKDGSWRMRLRKLTIVSRFFRQSHFWQELFKVINHMPFLRCLSISGIDELPSEEYVPNFADLSNFFPSLTTINFTLSSAGQCVVFFAALAQLKRLFHLCLEVEFTQEDQKSEFSSLHLNPLLSL